MAIDPTISLGVQTPQQPGIMDQASKLVSMKNLMTQGQLQQQSLQMGQQELQSQKLKNAEEERKVRAMQATNSAIANNVTIGQDGSFDIDHDRVEAELTRAGFPDQALAYSKSRKEIEDAYYDHVTKQLDLASKRQKNVANMAQTVLNAPPELRAGVYAFTLKQAQAAGLVDPKQFQQFGLTPQYNGLDTEAKLQSLVDLGSNDAAGAFKARMEEKRAEAKATQEAETHAATLPGQKAESTKKQLDTESQALGAAKDQPSWDAALAQMPDDRKKLYPAQFSEPARQQAALQGVSPDTRATLGKYNSATELQYAADRGDKDAAKALRDLESREIRIETAKKYAEVNAMLGIGGAGAPGGAPAAGGPGGGGGGAPAAGLHGEDFLKTIDPGLANEVRALASGRMQFPTGAGNYRLQPLIRLVGQYDPNFDATNYQQRYKTRENFTNGKGADTVNALNTAIQHLSRLNNSIDGLGNYSGLSVLNMTANQLKNWAKEHSGDTAALNKFKDDVQAVSSEAVKAWRGSGGSEKDIQDWKASMNAADSPEGLKSSMKEIADLLEGKIVSQQNQLDQALGPYSDVKALRPESQATLDQIRGVKTPAPNKPAARDYGDPRITEDIMAKARKANPGISDAALAAAIKAKLDGGK